VSSARASRPWSPPRAIDEYVCLKNTGRAAVDLAGWIVEDQDGNVYTFNEYSLPSKDIVTIYTGSGDDRRLHKYWDLDTAVWDDDGETATARRATGHVVDRCHYSGAGRDISC
jgi:hypothetical protein